MSKVIVTGDQNGRVVTPAGENFGYIRVEKSTDTFTDRGFAIKKTVSALIFGKYDVLKSFGWQDGQEIDGTIVIKESLIPFNKKNPEKDLKVAGKSNVPCTKGGRNIYRRAVYTPDANAVDELIKHDNYIAADTEESIELKEINLSAVPEIGLVNLPDFGEEN